MRTKKALYNTISAALLQIVTIIVGLILPRLIIEVYGSSVNGLRASISQFIGYIYIIEMGLAGALIYSLYKPLAQDNISKINSILSTAKKVYNQIGVYFSILLIILTLIYPLFILKEDLNKLEVSFLVLAIGFTGIINYFTIAKYNVLLTAAQCNYVVSIIRIVYLIINTTIMVVLISYEARISFVYLIALIANIIQVLITVLYTRKHFKYINLNVQPDLDAMSKRSDVLVHQISEMVIMGSPIILLTFFSTLEDVSVYSIYSFVFVGITMVLGVLQTGFSSGFGQMIAQKEKDNLKTVYSQYELLYYMLLTYIYICTFILGIPFIKIYTMGLTDANYIEPILLYLFIILGITNNWKKPQSTIITSAGHFNETRNRAIFQAIITVVFSTILVIPLGMEGILIGSIIGHLYRSIDMLYSVKITRVSFIATLKRLIRNFLIGLITVVPFITVISINPKDFLEWIFVGILVSVWVGFMVITINYIFERSATIALISRLVHIFKR